MPKESIFDQLSDIFSNIEELETENELNLSYIKTKLSHVESRISSLEDKLQDIKEELY